MQALEKSKYEQSLESVQRFIAIAEKELELYYRHIALYGDPNGRDPIKILDVPGSEESRNIPDGKGDISFTCLSESDDSDREMLDIGSHDGGGKSSGTDYSGSDCEIESDFDEGSEESCSDTGDSDTEDELKEMTR